MNFLVHIYKFIKVFFSIHNIDEYDWIELNVFASVVGHGVDVMTAVDIYPFVFFESKYYFLCFKNSINTYNVYLFKDEMFKKYIIL